MSDAVKAAAARVRMERAERDRRWAAEDRIHKIAAARDAVVTAAKRRRIEHHRYCDATKDADAKTVASPDTMAPLVKACEALDRATDRLIALEEQA